MKRLNRKKSSFNLINLLVKIWNALTSIFKEVVSKLTPRFLLSSNHSKDTRLSKSLSPVRKSQSKLVDPFNEEAYKPEISDLSDKLISSFTYLNKAKLTKLFSQINEKHLITSINCKDDKQQTKTHNINIDELSMNLNLKSKENIFHQNKFSTITDEVQKITHWLHNFKKPITLSTSTNKNINRDSFMSLSAQLITLIASCENVPYYHYYKKAGSTSANLDHTDKDNLKSFISTSGFSLANATMDAYIKLQKDFKDVNVFDLHSTEKIYFREKNTFATRPLSIPEQLVRNLILRRYDIETGNKYYFDLLEKTEKIYLDYAQYRKLELKHLKASHLKESIDNQGSSRAHDEASVNTSNVTLESNATLETSNQPFLWKEKIAELRNIHSNILSEEKANNHGTTPAKIRDRGKR